MYINYNGVSLSFLLSDDSSDELGEEGFIINGRTEYKDREGINWNPLTKYRLSSKKYFFISIIYLVN